MMGRKRALTALLVMVVLAITSLSAGASIRMRVTGRRTTQPVVVYVPSRATLLATGYYGEALGVPPQEVAYGPPGPVFYGNYPYGGYGYGFPYDLYGWGVYVTPPAYQWGYSPLSPPLPLNY